MKTLTCLLAAVAAVFIGQAAIAGEQTIIDITPQDLTPQNTVFLPGVFKLDEIQNKVALLCLPSNGGWLIPDNPPRECPLDPLTAAPKPAMLYQLTLPPSDHPLFVVGNAGLNTDEWRRVQLARLSGADEGNLLDQFGSALNIARVGAAVRWSLDSSLLPATLKNEVPGSGLFYHISRTFPTGVPVAFGQGQSLKVEVDIGVPTLTVSGDAITTLNIGLIFQAPDVTGKAQPIQTIVSLFNSHGAPGKETTGSDGRNMFIATSIAPTSRYIVPVSSTEPFHVPGAHRLFAFTITQQAEQAAIQALNVLRASKGMPLLDVSKGTLLFKNIEMRSESRFLDKGKVKLAEDVSLLRVSIDSP